jgi:glycosyltransferase involved in cell wall biosynthesis
METKTPLLSIIIPTKNRQYTCLYAIESAIILNKKDLEIIVQDCSDTDMLKMKIVDKFGKDPRISYEYADNKPSMTENWNRAFARATGVYKCGIGDDDAVLPNIYDIAKRAKENNIEAVGHSKKYLYAWPDYTYMPEYASKLIIKNSYISEEIKIYDRGELDELLRVQAAIPNMNYMKLPMVYHCLLASSLIDNLIIRTGKFLDGTSLDVYSAFCLGLLVDKFYVYSTPFTLPGACGASNSNRSRSKSMNLHFAEYKSIENDKRIPGVHYLTFTIAESTQKAFSNLNDTRYSKLLDLPYLYADFLSHFFNMKMIRELYRLMQQNKFRAKDYFKFTRLYFLKLISAFTFKVKGFAKTILYSSKYLKEMILKGKQNYSLYDSNDILDAVNVLKTKDDSYLSSNKNN